MLVFIPLQKRAADTGNIPPVMAIQIGNRTSSRRISFVNQNATSAAPKSNNNLVAPVTVQIARNDRVSLHQGIVDDTPLPALPPFAVYGHLVAVPRFDCRYKTFTSQASYGYITSPTFRARCRTAL